MAFTRLKKKWKKLVHHDDSSGARDPSENGQSNRTSLEPNGTGAGVGAGATADADTDTDASPARVDQPAPHQPPSQAAEFDRPGPSQATSHVTPHQTSSASVLQPTAADLTALEAAATAPPTIAEAIWNQAYDQIKEEDDALVSAYEKIMSSRIQGSEIGSTTLEFESMDNSIELDPGLRRRQMHKVIRAGLEKTGKEAKAKETVGTTMQVVKAAMDLVDKAVKDVPQAALPWAVISLSLEVLANPLSQTDDNREGIKYVMDIMDWNATLAACLLTDDEGGAPLLSIQSLQEALRKRITSFYQMLLTFEMKSVISYYSHRGLVFLRDLVKLDSWADDIKAIKETQKDLDSSMLHFNNAKLVASIQQQHRQQRTQGEHDRDMQCLKDLRVTDPRNDKDRIERTKGGLHEDSFRWVLENEQYRSWVLDASKKVLWMRGDPGKGKTMLLCGIVNELTRLAPAGVIFFFFQATVPDINNHIALLRGLIWLLAEHRPSLIHYIRKRYDASGRAAFEGPNAWWTLTAVLQAMLREAGPIYIVIDALDECVTQKSLLLKFLHSCFETTSAKWILSSRNQPDIENVLGPSGKTPGVGLSLEVNASVVTKAVSTYITHRVSEMSKMPEISSLLADDELRENITRQLRWRARGTFLWAAIVINRLEQCLLAVDTAQEALDLLLGSLDDLSGLFTLMLRGIDEEDPFTSKRCKTILATVTLAYRQLTIHELATMSGFTGNLAKVAQLEQLVMRCGSFLTVENDSIFFVHYSAAEFLKADEFAQQMLFPKGFEEAHYEILARSIACMDKPLRRNANGLQPNFFRRSKTVTLDDDRTKAILYACSYWMEHLLATNPSMVPQKEEKVGRIEKLILPFFMKHFLHWAEVMLILNDSKHLMRHLGRVQLFVDFHRNHGELSRWILDARRLIQDHGRVMDLAPLQLYSSVIFFSPEDSLIRQTRPELVPLQIMMRQPPLESWPPTSIAGEWRQCLAITNRAIVAQHFGNKTVRIQDCLLQKELVQFRMEHDVIKSWFPVDPDIVWVATSYEVSSWRISSGMKEQAVGLDNPEGDQVWFSDNGNIAVSMKEEEWTEDFADDSTEVSISIYDIPRRTSRQVQYSLPSEEEEEEYVERHPDLLVTNDGNFLAVQYRGKGGYDIGDVARESWWEERLEGPLHFSSGSRLIASVARDHIIQIRSLASRRIVRELVAPPSTTRFLRFSDDSKRLFVYLSINLVQMWSVETGSLQGEWWDNSMPSATQLVLSPDSKLLATGTIICEVPDCHDIEGQQHYHSTDFGPMSTSRDVKIVAFWNHGLHVWDAVTGRKMSTLLDGGAPFQIKPETVCLGFSKDSTMILAFHRKFGLRRFDIASGREIPLPGSWDETVRGLHRSISATISQTGRFVFVDEGGLCSIWNLNEGHEAIVTTSCRGSPLTKVTVSASCDYLAVRLDSCRIGVWSVARDAEAWSFVCTYCSTSDGIWDDELFESDDEDGDDAEGPATVSTPSSTASRKCRCLLSVSDDGSAVLRRNERREATARLHVEGKDPVEICVGDYFSLEDYSADDPVVLMEGGRTTMKDHHGQCSSWHKERGNMAQGKGRICSGCMPDGLQGYGLYSLIGSARNWLLWNGQAIMDLPLAYSPNRTEEGLGKVVVWQHGMAYFARGQFCLFNFAGPPSARILDEVAGPPEEDY